MFTVYTVVLRDHNLGYVGQTSNIKRRMTEHKSKYGLVVLFHSDEVETRAEALIKEKEQIKKLAELNIPLLNEQHNSNKSFVRVRVAAAREATRLAIRTKPHQKPRRASQELAQPSKSTKGTGVPPRKGTASYAFHIKRGNDWVRIEVEA
jgi:predicted GIY-YIG superfamily endonuclease